MQAMHAHQNTAINRSNPMKFSTLSTNYIGIFSLLMLMSAQSEAASAAIPRHQENQRALEQQLDQASDSDSEQDVDSELESHQLISINVNDEAMQSVIGGIKNVKEGIASLKDGVAKLSDRVNASGQQINQNIAALNPDHFFEKITSAAIGTICLVAGLYFSAQDRKIRAPLLATLPNMRLPELLRYYWHYEIFCPRNFLFLMSWAAYSDMRKTAQAPALAQPPVIQNAPQAGRL